MDVSVYSAMSAVKQQEQLIAVHSNNIANANTNGFKSDNVAFKALYLNHQQAGTVGGYTELKSTGLDLTPGALNHTGNPKDITVAGNGFFQLKNASGDLSYVRTLSLLTNQDGLLVNMIGERIQDVDGKSIHTGGEDFVVDGSGNVLKDAGGNQIHLGKLKVVELPREEAIKSPSGTVTTNPEFTPKNVQNSSVVSGYLESSNVNSVAAMAQLIEAQRNYELGTKLFKAAKSIHSSSNSILK